MMFLMKKPSLFGLLGRSFSASTASKKTAIVVGGNGALGQSIVSKFNECGWNTVSIDFKSNDSATSNVTLDVASDWVEQVETVGASVKSSGFESHAVINVAGGWAGGDVGTRDGLQAVDAMWKMNLQSACLASHLGMNCMMPKGLLVLTGASAALSATPFMAGYGMSKAATHHLIKSLASGQDGALTDGKTVLGVLPLTIDTPGNRAGMPGADFSAWTSPDEIANKIFDWTTGERPTTGTLHEVSTTAGSSMWKETGKICNFSE